LSSGRHHPRESARSTENKFMLPENPLPWRKRRESLERKKASMWRRRTWGSRVAWTIAGGVITFVLLHGNEGLKNLRQLPTEMKRTAHSFQSWLYDDEKWTRTWYSREELDVEDYDVAHEPIKLSLHAVRGQVLGELYLPTVCERNPLLLPVLVEGEVLKGKIYAKAFAYVGGEQRPLATFTVTISKEQPWIVTLQPLSDPSGLMPESARLQTRIDGAGANVQTEHEDLSCKNDRIEFLRKMRDLHRKISRKLDI
jgi:hypothetical protein